MYSTCLFCNRPLGANQEIEHMSVGSRLAFDPAGGRLWVVCRACERWNLSPFETRWEAIEEAERAFRSTPMRIATDNIALARLPGDTELVRIGKPPALELAAWRYGDQFGRRRRKTFLLAAAPAAIAGLQLAMSLSHLALIGIAFSGLSIASSSYTLWRHKRDRRERALVVRDAENRSRVVSIQNCRGADFVRGDGDALLLRVPYMDDIDLTSWADTRRIATRPHVVLQGAPAQRALATMLPLINSGGGSRRHVRDAVTVLTEAKSLDSLIRDAAVNPAGLRRRFGRPLNSTPVGLLVPRLRLAMEMALHEHDERRAMDGALDELYERWRDADAIARIADSLLLPDDVNRRFEEMRSGLQ